MQYISIHGAVCCMIQYVGHSNTKLLFLLHGSTGCLCSITSCSHGLNMGTAVTRELLPTPHAQSWSFSVLTSHPVLQQHSRMSHTLVPPPISEHATQPRMPAGGGTAADPVYCQYRVRVPCLCIQATERPNERTRTLHLPSVQLPEHS
jgi:hypothetical protein